MSSLVISDGLIFKGLAPKEKQTLKKALTFDNPKYAQVKKYSPWGNTNVSPYLFYYEEVAEDFKVPIGVNRKIAVDSIQDFRNFEQISQVPKFVLKLREDQFEASQAFLKAQEKTFNFNYRSLIQMPTGKGKSILGLYLASELKCKTLVVVHKDDLINGWFDDIKLAFDNKVNTGLIKAKHFEVGDFITLATVQTLSKLPKDILSDLFDTFGFVIQDEVHHAPSTSFALINNFKSGYRLGLTATSERADGLSEVINLFYGDFAHIVKHSLTDEDILPVKVIPRILEKVYLNPVFKKSNGKFSLVNFEAENTYKLKDDEIRYSNITGKRPLVNFSKIDNFVTNELLDYVLKDVIHEYALGRSCVVFFTQREHCSNFYDLLKSKKVDCGLYYGKNKLNSEVKDYAEKHRRFVTVTTYKKTTEGTNVKQWEVAFFASSMNSGLNVEQASGRVRRTTKGKKLDTAIIYDYRTPNAIVVKNHVFSRDSRYSKMGFSLLDSEGKKRPLFSKGFK